MAPLVFKLSTTAFGRFQKVVEALAVAILRDFGMTRKDSRKLAWGLCGGIKATISKAGDEEIRCTIRRDGGSGTLELVCGRTCNLSHAAEAAERLVKVGKAVTAVRLDEGKSNLILELRYPKEK
jgi:hypothetical protein